MDAKLRVGPPALRWRRTGNVLAAALVTLTLAVSATSAHGSIADAAHPEAVLESDRSSVAAGSALPLRGSAFGASEAYTLRLLGVLDEHDLGDVTSNGEGTISLEVAIPREARPGAYQVVAIAPDGDVVARLDVTVTAAAAMAEEEHAAMSGGMADTAAPEARADEITIDRDRSGIEWAAIGLVIGVAGGLGIGLRRKRPV